MDAKGGLPIATKNVGRLQQTIQEMRLTGIKQRQCDVEIIDFRDWEVFVMESCREASRNDLRRVTAMKPSKK